MKMHPCKYIKLQICCEIPAAVAVGDALQQYIPQSLWHGDLILRLFAFSYGNTVARGFQRGDNQSLYPAKHAVLLWGNRISCSE